MLLRDNVLYVKYGSLGRRVACDDACVATGRTLDALLRDTVTAHVRGHALRVHAGGRGSVPEVQPDIPAHTSSKRGMWTTFAPLLLLDMDMTWQRRGSYWSFALKMVRYTINANTVLLILNPM